MPPTTSDPEKRPVGDIVCTGYARPGRDLRFRRNERPVVYMVCTGNAARSPMAAAMLRDLDSEGRIDVRSAGVLAVEGHPLGPRTRSALARHGLADHDHRSRQLDSHDAADADLVVVMEPLHLLWIRRELPSLAPISGSLRRLARDLDPPAGADSAGDDATAGTSADLRRRVTSLGLARLTPEAWEEVVDPAGGSQDAFDRCSDELSLLVAQLHRRL
ncbi:MAG: low molecular weight phosphatase family protein [Acidimicrobiaceae bacterium]|nr:low molecular weight phosphatase family protein [Acidimicrobiaceae bacterium]